MRIRSVTGRNEQQQRNAASANARRASGGGAKNISISKTGMMFGGSIVAST